MLDHKTVRLCKVHIKACPREWDKLAETTRDDVRHCSECDRDVHFSTSDEDTIAKARAGLCVARWEPHPDSVRRRLVLGRPIVSKLPPLTPEEEAVLTRSRRERGIAESLARVGYATVDCAQCGYPVPKFRKSCYVCGTSVR